MSKALCFIKIIKMRVCVNVIRKTVSNSEHIPGRLRLAYYCNSYNSSFLCCQSRNVGPSAEFVCSNLNIVIGIVLLVI